MSALARRGRALQLMRRCYAARLRVFFVIRFLRLPALLVLLPTGLAAQSPPALPSRHDTLTARYGETVIGRGIMHWARQGAEFLQVYIWTSAHDGATVTDSLFADARTLQPRREVRVLADTAIIVSYEDSALRIRTLVAGLQAEERSVPRPATAYSSASLEALAAAMPQTVGASATFDTYFAPPSPHQWRTTRIRVEATEVVGGRLAWRVVAETPGGGTTFWVDEATRTVLQSDTREGSALITFRR